MKDYMKFKISQYQRLNPAKRTKEELMAAVKPHLRQWVAEFCKAEDIAKLRAEAAASDLQRAADKALLKAERAAIRATWPDTPRRGGFTYKTSTVIKSDDLNAL